MMISYTSGKTRILKFSIGNGSFSAFLSLLKKEDDDLDEIFPKAGRSCGLRSGRIQLHEPGHGIEYRAFVNPREESEFFYYSIINREK